MTIDYRNQRIIDEVEEDRKKIVDGLKQTETNTEGINSIIRLLEMQKATIYDEKDLTEDERIEFMLNSVLNRIDKLGSEINDVKKISDPNFSNKRQSQLTAEINMLRKKEVAFRDEKEEFYNRLKRLEVENQNLKGENIALHYENEEFSKRHNNWHLRVFLRPEKTS